MRKSSAAVSSITDALDVLRARQWIHFALLPAASAYSIAGARPLEALGRFGAGAAVAALCLAYAYGVNAIADRHGDRSRAKNPLAGERDVPAAVAGIVAATGALALCTACALGPGSALAGALSLVAGSLYSIGPRFKAVPYLSTATNALIFAPLLLLGGSVSAADASGLRVLMVAFVALLTQNQLVHEVADRDEDIASGVRTTAVALGARPALVSAALLGAVAAALLATSGTIGLIAAVGVLVGGVVVATSSVATAARTRRAHRFFALAIGAVLLAMLTTATRSS